MRIFGLGWPELLLILVVVLILFGPKRLPQIGQSLGKTLRAVREGVDGKDEIEEEAPTPAPKTAEAAQTAEAPSPAPAAASGESAAPKSEEADYSGEEKSE
jgi:sec-independent protein translocase protein TatA